MTPLSPDEIIDTFARLDLDSDEKRAAVLVKFDTESSAGVEQPASPPEHPFARTLDDASAPADQETRDG